MKWILRITLFSYKGACIFFGNHYITNMQESLSVDYIKVRTLCIPKEDK